ncbi:MAG: hypothetical protein ACI4II_02825 [Acutalibacteraceae bacterium]
MIIKNWNQKSPLYKFLTVIGCIISVTIVILAFMQLFNVWDKAINVFEPLLGVLMIIQAIENWKTNRKTAYISLFAAFYIFAVAAYILF